MYIFPSVSVLFFHGVIALILSGPLHHLGFTITLRHTTLGRIPLDEWSARRREIYLTTPNTKKDIHDTEGFEPAIAASERPQTIPVFNSGKSHLIQSQDKGNDL